MEEEKLMPTNPATDVVVSPNKTGYEAFKQWAEKPRVNLGLSAQDVDPGLPAFNMGGSGGGQSGKNVDTNSIDFLLQEHDKKRVKDTSEFTYSNLSKRYPHTFVGLDNEEIYAQSQSTGEKAYNGVAKMAGTAATTFVNGTAGTIYGIMDMRETGKLSSFYNNDLSNYLNNINKEMEDSYAHYKTQREINGSWWEPANLFTANFLFDNVIKNLGYSVGAMGAGFAWGGAIKALGLTGRLISTGEKWATAADAAISEASALAQTERLAAATSNLQKLWQTAKSTAGQGLMKTDRFIVATFGTMGESGIEALNNSQQFRDNMISKFKETNGYNPEGEDLEEINKYAEQVGNWSFGLNTALLSATNYIQLPKIYASSFRGERQIANGIIREGEQYVSSLPKSGFGKLAYKARNIASLGFNTAEAFEEGAQFAIQTGVQNYFDKKYSNEDVSGLSDGLLFGVKEALFTDEGTLNIFTGGFSGALQSSGIIGMKDNLPTIGKTGKIGERGFTGYGGEQGRLREEAIKSFNDTKIKDKLRDISGNIKASAKIQQEREIAIRQGDILESKDLEFDYAHSFISSRVKYGAKEFINTEIAELEERALTNSGFEELKQEGIAFKEDTKERFLARLNNIKEHADSASKLYSDAEIKYKGLVNTDTGERVYSDEVIDKLVYAGAKILDYDKRIPQLNQDLAAVGIPTQNILNDIVVNGTPSKEVMAEAVNQIKALHSINEDDLLTNLNDIAEIGSRRKLFIDEYNEIRRTPEKFKQSQSTVSTTVPTSQKETVTVKTKTGTRDIEIGTEYFLGKVVERDKLGNEVFRAPKVVILGVNEDGTLQVQNVVSKKITNVDPSKLEDYMLGKVSDATKKDLWINDNWNTIFVHRGLKDKEGNYRKGRIQNHPAEGMMYFVYTNEKGKEVKVPVKNEMFVPKPGTEYKRGIIAPLVKLTAVKQQTLEQLFSTKEEVTVNQIDERNKYLADLYEKGLARIEEVNKKIEANQETLKNKAKELAEKTNELTYTKKGTLRKGGFNTIQTSINTINSIITTLENENEELSLQREELEFTVPFYKEVIDSLSEFPDDNSALIAKMKSQVKIVEDLITATKDTITLTERLLKQANDLYNDAVELIKDFIQKIKTSNPELPTIYIEEYQEMNEKFLGEEGAKQLIENRQGFTSRLLQFQSDISAFTDEINLPKLGDKAQVLTQDLNDLAEGLSELVKENNVRKTILSGFQQFVDEMERKLEEESKINNDPKVKSAVIKTADKATVQTRETNLDYEPVAKKATNVIARSTAGVNRGKLHQIRANKFGIDLYSFENRDDIRGVYITAKNEKELIPGLIDHLRTDEQGVIDESIDKNEIIALVMVNKDGNLVGVDGLPITEDPINSAIYQVLPDPKFEWSAEFGRDGKPVSMFRAGTPEDIKAAVIEQYKKDRELILESDFVGEQHSIGASFGIPILERLEDGSIDYDARNTVTETNLIQSIDELEQRQVITVPTTGDVESQGLTSYMNAIGKPFIKLANGIVPLQNRRHTNEEAETIFNALVQLSTNMMDPKEGIRGDKSVRLLTYLKSVVYWGIPEDAQGKRKNTGYNSIFFDEDPTTGKLMLTISKEGNDVRFTPSELLRNKGEMIDRIKELYSNINSSMTKKINDKYEQIVSISENGDIESVTWPNYQSYLVSDILPNEDGELKGSSRSKDDIPLTTIMRPVNNEAGIVNRTGVYFYTTDNADDYAFADIQKRTATTKRKITPGKIEQKPEEPTEEVTDWVLDGATVNTFIDHRNKKVSFTVLAGTDASNFESNILITDVEDAADVINFVKKALKTQDSSVAVDALKKKYKADILKSLPKTEVRETKATKKGYNPFSDKKTPKKPAQSFSQEAQEEEVEEEKEIVTPKAATSVEKRFGKSRRILRQVVRDHLTGTEIENWADVENFIKTSFPNVPVYRVKNILENSDKTVQAWGMFKDGAIYLYEKAEVGTAYHEVFEAVWDMFTTPQERVNLIKEFKARDGKFLDRPSQTMVNYNEASPEQIREQLAEEARDYFKDGKIPVKPRDGRPFILKLFADLLTTIKNFFIGSKAASNTERLFEKISQGKFAKKGKYSEFAYANKGLIDINEAMITDDASLRKKLEISDIVRNEIIQEMTFATLLELVDNDKSLFDDNAINKKDLYSRLFNNIQGMFDEIIEMAEEMKNEKEISAKEFKETKKKFQNLKQATEDQWDSLVARHEEYLKGYSIDFDENDILQINEEDKVKESDQYDATKIDHFKKANRAIKLLLSTLPYVDSEGNAVTTSIGGVRLIPISKVFINLLNNVSDASNPTRMMEKLRVMAENDANYRTLYKRLTKKAYNEGEADLTGLDTSHAAQLVTAFWKTFKKYNAAVKNISILENGEVTVGEAHLSNIANQLRSQFESSIVVRTKAKQGYFFYSEKEKAYISDAKKVIGVKLTTKPSLVAFLKELGVDFTIEEINRLEKDSPKEFDKFKKATFGIKESLLSGSIIFKINSKYANINKRLLELAYLKAKLSNPDANSTFFNISGEMTQSYIGPNAPSQLYEAIAGIKSLTPAGLSEYPQYNYLLTDVFSKGSRVLKRMFTPEGKRKEDTSGDLDNLLQSGYVGGIDNQAKGKQKSSSKLNYKERLIQEINLNLKGWYLNLIPGDASLEHMTNMGNEIASKDIAKGMDSVYTIFKDYFISELLLSRENREIAFVKLSAEDKKNGKRPRQSSDLRFFKSILDEKLHDQIIAEKGTPEEVYKKFSKKINDSLNEYIANDVKMTSNVLLMYNILKETEEGIELSNIALPKNMSDQQFEREMKTISINYMIANIEMHKLLYSDPYQYSDELKRIKSFNSPRQLIVGGNDGINEVFNKVWNKGFSKKDYAFTNFLSTSFRTVTVQDVTGISDLLDYGTFTETDGGGIVTMKANRHFRIREGRWNDQEEEQFRYDIAYEKVVKGQKLSKEEEKYEIKQVVDKLGNIKYKGKNPQVQSAYTNIKPIVTGNKNDGNDYNDIVLDKFALYPLSFRIMHEINPESNALKMYDKMQAQDIDYFVYDSGRKVGSKNSHAPYNEDGSFNTDPFIPSGENRNIINVPYEIISVQSDVPSKETPLVRRGTQVTKLVTMDFMDGGVPVDFMEDEDTEANFSKRYKAWYSLSEEAKLKESPLYKEIKNNQMLLEGIIEEGVSSLLKSLGITYSKGKYEINDFTEAGKTIRDEILKREVNDNLSDALKDFLENGVALEATPAYQQVRNILYSIADREVISSKISGGMKVQISATFLETTKSKLTEINGKKGYTSDTLAFYSEEKDVDGKRTKVNVCELMVGRWFKSSMTDAELIDYLNNSEEGQQILSGMAYRIPTQAANSIDVFKIKQFLPKEFKDSVVVPSALVAKVGSDFDIDKLTIYFKNIYKDLSGKPRLVPFYGTGQDAKDKFGKMYEDTIKKQIEKITNFEEFRENLLDLFETMDNGDALSEDQETFYKTHGDIIDSMEDQAAEEELTPYEYTLNQIVLMGEMETSLREKLFNEELKDKFITKKYKESLQNAFIQSGENLVSHPKNYDRLIRPNSADELKDLAKFVAEKTIGKSFDYTDVGNMLNRRFMSRLRHAFVTGKYAIGIAAVNQTNHSLNQRSMLFLDPKRLSLVDPADKEWLGDAEIKFRQYNKINIGGRTLATMSKIKNAAGRDISSILGQFIDGYVDISKGPWIMELGATPNVASTWMFLAKIGVPIDTITYFMNQPIIKDYLRSIENDGYSYLFMDSYVENAIVNYGGKDASHTSPAFKATHLNFEIPSKGVLKETVGKTNLTAQEKETQQHILIEFMKYAKMAEQTFHVTQGSNFDTANFNDPYLVFKKRMQLEKANNTIIASVDSKGSIGSGTESMLDNSFLRTLSNSIYGFRDALSEILISDQKKTRQVIQKVLLPHIGLPDRQFVKVSQKVVADFFDWAVQTDGGTSAFNNYIETFMINNQGVLPNVAKFIKEVKSDPEHPLYNNQVVNIIELLPSSMANAKTPNNIQIKGIDNKVYDQNNIIYGFREIRNYLKESSDESYKNLYKQLIFVSILQSGLSGSKISYSSVLPYEDFQPLYNKVIGKLNTMSGLSAFHDLGVFERNNWNNDDIIPHKRAGYIPSLKVYNPSMNFLADNIQRAIHKKEIPPVLTQAVGDREARYDYMVYSWEVDVPVSQGQTQAQRKAEMKKAGDYSFIKKGLFRKVYDNFGNPFVHKYLTKAGVLKEYFVYKAINAWGDSYRANEFYDVEKQSVYDNGFIKVNEGDNRDIIELFQNKGDKKTISKKVSESNKQVTKQSIRENSSTKKPSIETSFREEDEFEPYEEDYDSFEETPFSETTTSNKNIEIVERYSVSEVKKNPNKIYVFGDNVLGSGKAGQAVIRDEKNAFGIPTKISPNTSEAAYFNDSAYEKNIKVISSSIQVIKGLQETGKTIVMPKDGFGTGLAKLKEKAPKTYAFLKHKLLEEFGFDNDKGIIINEKSVSLPVGLLKKLDMSKEEWDSLSTKEQQQIIKCN